MNQFWASAQGYARDGMRALVILNGAGAFASLFLDRRPAIPYFVAGIVASVLLFTCAYVTQLEYGNDRPTFARRFHSASYVLVFAALLAMVLGFLLI